MSGGGATSYESLRNTGAPQVVEANTFINN